MIKLIGLVILSCLLVSCAENRNQVLAEQLVQCTNLTATLDKETGRLIAATETHTINEYAGGLAVICELTFVDNTPGTSRQKFIVIK